MDELEGIIEAIVEEVTELVEDLPLSWWFILLGVALIIATILWIR